MPPARARPAHRPGSREPPPAGPPRWRGSAREPRAGRELAAGLAFLEEADLRVLVQHRSEYRYPRPAALGPHLVRLRPAPHTRARVESYGLTVPREAAVRWQQDPAGNHVAHLGFERETRLDALTVAVELALELRPVNPFDFVVDERCERAPFAYPRELALEIAPYLEPGDPALAGGPRLAAFLEAAPRSGETVPFLVELNRAVHGAVRYVVREEPGLWTPEETLSQGRGSCRDQAVLLLALLRSRGFAARFASGYLVQLADEGMIPDEPRGVGRDVVDLHAWVEVFLPGAGWIGLDPTSGLLTGEGHVPLACVARPALAAPIEGTADVAASAVRFEAAVGRLGHEVRPTAPFSDATWDALLQAADAADGALRRAGLALTTGGEPTFNARDGADAPEWNGEALGPGKWPAALRLAEELRARFTPGGAILSRQGKWYPGEPLPRWALEVIGRADGAPIWSVARGVRRADPAATRALAEAIAVRLGVEPPQPAHEDPWALVREEAALPLDVDPLAADLTAPGARRRLARLLGADPGAAAGWVLPLARHDGAWRSQRWTFRHGHLFLVPGDAPIGLRLPLSSLSGAPPPPVTPPEPPLPAPDPRREPELEALQARLATAGPPPAAPAIHTALAVELREGALRVFLPPLASAEDFLELVAAVDATRAALGLDVQLEGYPPPASPALRRIGVAPDPGVLEVNVPPSLTGRAHAELLLAVHDAAAHAGLQTEKYLLDGRLAGSGGGHHLTLGGPSPLASPLVRRPDLLASLITFHQHHPSLAYLFTGLFVGPTSQAPRLDEARHDALYEMEIALDAAFDAAAPPPWWSDLLFRHLLVDVAGNTHRAELSIDKLFDPRTAQGRQGLVELRAFEMPPHPRLAAAQAILARALVAAFAGAPYRAPLVRWGAALHDRFLLPAWVWRDFEEVLAALAERGVALPPEPYRAFLELRCPQVGRIATPGGTLELRNALEPWPVLGEEASATGTSRWVDSSTERVEVRAEGLIPERHRVMVNGLLLPMRPTGTAGELVGGVRFRAWAPAHGLHAHLGIHHPLRVELVDLWARRSLGACAYHVWHPEGRAFSTPPLTRQEAAARRAQRFTVEGPTPWPVLPRAAAPHPEMPYTLDLRRFPVDRTLPRPAKEEA